MSRFTEAQSQAIETLAVNVAVAAGAGAGKTRVLVERYVNILVQEKASCEEIIAITFTKKAAKEMRERIRVELAKHLAQADASSWPYWNELKNRLEYAPISTFHSLCSRILRENPVEAGLDPNFTVLEENENQLLFQKTVENMVLQAADKQEPWLAYLLTEYNLRNLYEDFPVIYEDLEAAGWIGDGLAAKLSAPYETELGEMKQTQEALQSVLKELIAYADELKAGSAGREKLIRLAVHLPEIEAALLEPRKIDFPALWQDKVKEVLKNIRLSGAAKETKEQLDVLYSKLCGTLACSRVVAAIPYLADYYQTLQLTLAAAKQAQQGLSFADLENKTLHLLKNYPEICRKYNRKYRYIMVDEFQDTNDRQREFIYLLAGGDANILKENKLFIVGDPKQSIYRFRGADVRVFERVQRDILAGGGRFISLDTNFRSQTGLISLGNRLFERFFEGDDLVAFQPTRGHKNCQEQDRFAEWLVLPKINKEEETLDRRSEAAMIAKRLKQLVTESRVYDERQEVMRPVNYGDIAILFRAFTDISLYEGALQAEQIPYYVLGGRGFFAKQEILDVIHLLRVIDNCYDDQAWIGILRSPIFLITDLTLVAITAENQSIWQGLTAIEQQSRVSEEEKQVCWQAVRFLTELRRLREFLPLAELLEIALSKSGYREFLLSQFMGQQKVANVDKFCLMAYEQEQSGASLAEFLAYINEVLVQQVQESEAQIESETGNTVKLLTIHKSKGLEYPVVVLPDLQRKFSAGSEKVIFTAEQSFALGSSDGEFGQNSVYDRLKQEAARLERLELKRLLYVAQTRAKDYLILSSIDEQRTAKDYSDKEYSDLANWHQWFMKCFSVADFSEAEEVLTLGEDKLQLRYYEDTASNESAVQISDVAFEVEPDVKFITDNLQAIGEDIAGIEPLFSATMLGRYCFCPRAYFYRYMAEIPDDIVFDSSPAIRQSEQIATGGENTDERVPALILGKVVHKFIEIHQQGSLEVDLHKAALLVVPEEIRDAAVSAALPFCQTYCASEFCQDILAESVESEWNFTTLVQKEKSYYFRGVIDRLVEREESIEIVDFKTDALVDQTQGRWTEHYVFQLQLYAWAAARLRMKPVTRASLYFLRTNEIVSIPILSQDEFLNQLLQDCDFLLSHGQEEEYPYHKENCAFCSYCYFCKGAYSKA